MKQDFTYKSQDGHHIEISAYGVDHFGERPCLLYLHGFKGFKDWGFVPFAGEYFVKAGFSFIAFNFSHNGIGADPLAFTELEKFEKNTYLRELKETEELIHLCVHTDFFGMYLKHKLGLIGHSRGGGVALLSGNNSPDVSAVCTWASISTVERFTKQQRETWRKQGYWEVVNSRTKQVFRLGLDMLNEIERFGKSKLNILKAVQDLDRPLLMLHGQEDESVPFFEAEQLNIYADPARARLRLIPNAGHTFGAKHPFEASGKALDEVLDLSADFFRNHLIQ
ncbi:MAG: dienelactone hydrolase family protein [Bacteroidota bacterium]